MRIDLSQLITAYISAYWYMHTKEETLNFINELQDAICNGNRKHYYEVDMLYSILVNFCGDYGVSMRSGWINTNLKPILLDMLGDEFSKYTKLDEDEEI